MIATSLLIFLSLVSSEPLRSSIDEWNKSQKEAYRLRIEKSEIKSRNETRILMGSRSDEAVLILHGFMASPEEVAPLAKKLHAQGFTVLTPLIFGFGSSTAIANSASVKDWRQSFLKGLNLLSRNFKRVHLVGFSLGGGIILDDVLSSLSPQKKSQKKFSGKIASLTLISPYIVTAERFAAFSNLASQFTDGIPLKKLYSLSENPDLVVPIANSPEYYSDELPLKAVDTLLDLSDRIEKSKSQQSLKIPVFLAYSEADATIGWEKARNMILHLFKNVEVRAYPDHEGVRHQMLSPSSHHDASELIEKISRFIERN